MEVDYWADNEHEEELWVTDSKRVGYHANWMENPGGNQLYFAELPKRRKRDAHPARTFSSIQMTESVLSGNQPEFQVSQYSHARWLQQLFVEQKRSTEHHSGSRDSSVPIISDGESTNKQKSLETTLSDSASPKVIPSHHRIHLEEAMSFSVLPRIIIEADIPHRVVHANGAFELYFGYTTRLAANSFQSDHVRTLRDFQTTVVAALFNPNLVGPDATINMYPVLGAETNGFDFEVTHYLFEASKFVPSLKSLNDPWLGSVPQVVA